MTAINVTIIDQLSSDRAKRELATRLTEALVALERDHQPWERQGWRVVARAVRSPGPEPAPDRGVASLDYATWHAHLTGTRRWVPGSDRTTV
jgi:hypothetical protein